jgi:hypothetical protein
MVDTSQGELRAARSTERPPRSGWPGWGPLSGIAFVILFTASVFTDATPNANASNAAWTAYFASASHRDLALASGFLGVIAALALLSFLVIIWTRIAAVSRSGVASPLPVAAAAVSAACLAVGSLLQALIPGSMIFNSLPEPSPGILRVFDEVAGPLILVGAMFAFALALASLTLQARAAGAFGTRMTVFSLIVAVITLASFQFFPVLAPLIWVVTVSVVVIRRPALVRTS